MLQRSDKNAPPKEVNRSKNLTEILQQKADLYLTEDNPAPTTPFHDLNFQSTFNAISTFFYNEVPRLLDGRGRAGHQRAKKYKTDCLSNTAYTEEGQETLFKQVFCDIVNDQGPLETSYLFRQRLLEGLCEYGDISKEKIETLVQQALSKWVSIHSHSMSSEALSMTLMQRQHSREVRRDVMVNLLIVAYPEIKSLINKDKETSCFFVR